MLIYKIIPADLWNEAVAQGVFKGAPVDHQDGFIHFSTAAQVEETARKHFHGQRDLLFVSVEDQDLGPALRYEPSRGGALFPHLYAPLPVALAKQVRALPMNEDGTHQFETLLP